MKLAACVFDVRLRITFRQQPHANCVEIAIYRASQIGSILDLLALRVSAAKGLTGPLVHLIGDGDAGRIFD